MHVRLYTATSASTNVKAGNALSVRKTMWHERKRFSRIKFSTKLNSNVNHARKIFLTRKKESTFTML